MEIWTLEVWQKLNTINGNHIFKFLYFSIVNFSCFLQLFQTLITLIQLLFCLWRTQSIKFHLKGLSYSYFSVFGILIFFLYVLTLHPYIPKIKNSDGGSTLISDILTQIVISSFSLEILRKLPSFVFFTTKSL